MITASNENKKRFTIMTDGGTSMVMEADTSIVLSIDDLDYEISIIQKT